MPQAFEATLGGFLSIPSGMKGPGQGGGGVSRVKGNARVRCEGWWEPEAVDYKSNGRKQFCNSMNMASRWLDVT